MSICIALDAMGGDHGIKVVVPAAFQILSQYPDVHLILVGNQTLLKKSLKTYRPNSRLRIQHASQQVSMNDTPIKAFRYKKDSSMRIAINLVKKKQASACVSAGNTGALVAIASVILKKLPHIKRPAIISSIPTMSGHTHILDLGANINSSAEHLLQFALMGSISMMATNPNPPKVALLNIGVEKIKGDSTIKKAALLLEQAPINYIGFIEDIYTGQADLIVCNGLMGNIALKASEGVVHMINKSIEVAFNKNILTQIAGWVALPVIKNLHKNLDPRRYNGASLLGLQSIVIKSHGSADTLAFFYAIQVAINEIEKNIPEKISVQLANILGMTTTRNH